MATENLESTRISDMDVDQFCSEIVSNVDLLYADKIDDPSMIGEILNNDFFQEMDLSLSVISSDESFGNRPEDKLESLNIDIAEKKTHLRTREQDKPVKSIS